MQLAIIGYGTVGQATHAMLEATDNKVVIVDPQRGYGQDEATLKECAMFFVCVPTTEVEKVIDSLRAYEGLVVVRSSVLPGSMPPEIVMFPEFLSEIDPWGSGPHTQLLGGDLERVRPLRDLLIACGQQVLIVSQKEASEVKYTSNLYGIAKTLFWEMIEDVFGNERKLHHILQSVGVKQGDMSFVGMDGYRGIGGKCFPENLKLLRSTYSNTLLEALGKYDEELKKR